MSFFRPARLAPRPAALLLACLLPLTSRAQTVLPMEPPETPIPQMVVEGQIATQGPPVGPVLPPTPFSFGNLVLRPHLVYSYMDEHGMLFSPGNNRSSIVQNLAPGLLADWGQNWSANYTPTWIEYSNPVFHNCVDQLADIEGVFNPASFLVQISQTIAVTSDPESETGMQTTERNYNTALTVSKSFTSELAATGSFSQSLSSANVLYPDSRQWSGSGGLRFQWIPQVTFSLNLGAGFFEVVHSTDGYFISPTLGVAIATWNRKLTLNASAGVKKQTYYQRRAASAVAAPSGHVDATFHPDAATSLELLADTGESFSYLLDDGTRRTDWGASFNQQLLTHLNLAVTAMRAEVEYQNFGYEPGSTSAPVGRSDQINSLTASLGLVNVFKRGSIKAVFEVSRDNSSIPVYSYSSREIGIALSYTY
jgi:hypothetical protein